MEKFTVFTYSCCRDEFESDVYNVYEKESGREIFDQLLTECREDSEWEEYMDLWMGTGNGTLQFTPEELVEGDIESDFWIFNDNEEGGFIVMKGDKSELSEKKIEKLFLKMVVGE